jgi:hypothetical protein
MVNLEPMNNHRLSCVAPMAASLPLAHVEVIRHAGTEIIPAAQMVKEVLGVSVVENRRHQTDICPKPAPKPSPLRRGVVAAVALWSECVTITLCRSLPHHLFLWSSTGGPGLDYCSETS